MKLVALHGFCICGGVDVFAGDVFDAPTEHAGAYWIANGHARPYVAPPAPEAPAAIVNEEVEAPKPAKAEASTRAASGRANKKEK